MCGIAGIFNCAERLVSLPMLASMTQSLAHRGPDGEGHWINSNIGLGHRRLSIIDLSQGAAQPMKYGDSLVITFNGEIYNYIELRAELSKAGYVFKTESDTEVLLAGYHFWGHLVLTKLDGMFAFALWDEEKKELFCARDRFGEKPFFYAEKPEGGFVFASEMKALFAAGISSDINEEMLFLFLAWDIVEDPENAEKTFYRDVFRLDPAHYIRVKEGKIIEKARYWKISPEVQPVKISPEDAILCFRDIFNTSVRRRLRSDVPVGSSLSGGLDSSSVVAAISKNKPEKQHTFSARFSEPGFDEGFFMEKLREKIPFESHYVYPVQEDFFSSLRKVFRHQEEPFGSGSIFAQWEVMRTAAENKVTVLLDGQGSDEILAGYPKYYETFLRELKRTDKKLYQKEKSDIENVFSWKGDPEWKRNLESKAPRLVRSTGKIKRTFFAAENFKDLNPLFVNRFSRRIPFVNYNHLNQALAYDTTVYGLGKLLRFCDRNSMAFSREVRLPFLSHELVEFVFSLPSTLKIKDGWTKWILRKTMEPDLPSEISWRKDKMGFQAPHEKWLLSGVEMIRQYKEKAVARGYIKEEYSDAWKILMTGMLIEMAEGKNGG